MKTFAFAALAAALALPGVASAQIGGPQQIQEIRDAAPSCSANPQFPYIGRVSGGTENLLDRTMPVSFVGCFPDLNSCEAWKGAASGIITTTIIQYSCKQR